MMISAMRNPKMPKITETGIWSCIYLTYYISHYKLSGFTSQPRGDITRLYQEKWAEFAVSKCNKLAFLYILELFPFETPDHELSIHLTLQAGVASLTGLSISSNRWRSASHAQFNSMNLLAERLARFGLKQSWFPRSGSGASHVERDGLTKFYRSIMTAQRPANRVAVATKSRPAAV